MALGTSISHLEGICERRRWQDAQTRYIRNLIKIAVFNPSDHFIQGCHSPNNMFTSF